MLKKIFIHNLGLIQNAEIDFFSGFTAITGETGAGKSFFSRAIELGIGGRRTEKTKENEKTVIELEWNEHIFRRILEEKRSRFFVDDVPESLETAEKILGNLLHFHGQNETAFLRNAHAATELFDRGIEMENTIFSEKMQEFLHLFAEWKKCEHEKKTLSLEWEKISLQHDFWVFQKEKMESITLSFEEFLDAEKTVEEMKEQEKNRSAVQNAVEILAGETVSVLGQLNEVDRILEKLQNPLFEKTQEKIQTAFELVRETVFELEKNLPDHNFDFETAKNTVQKAKSMVKQFGVISFEQLLEKKNFFENAIANAEETQKKLENAHLTAEKFLQLATQKAEEIQKIREEYAEDFAQTVQEKCRNLGMLPAEFSVEFVPTALQKYGISTVEFLFSANKNFPKKPLHSVASGGEMARVMLALKQFFPHNATLLFDEIDTGVSGAIAEKMAEEMKRLSEQRQIISITHLPQIAAYADHHFVVEKTHGEKNSHTTIRKVEGEERVLTIAAMLSGEKISEEAINAARKLLEKSGEKF